MAAQPDFMSRADVYKRQEDISVYDDHICKLACFDGSHEILFAVSIRNIL